MPAIEASTVLFGVFALIVYCGVVFDDVPGGDAGELLSESCSLGVAHPPGYPLLTMMLAAVFRACGVVEASPAPPSFPSPSPSSPTAHSDGVSMPTYVTAALAGNLLSAVLSAGAAALLFSTAKCVISIDTSKLVAHDHAHDGAQPAAGASGSGGGSPSTSDGHSQQRGLLSVSYTHLTLPTKRIV